MRQKDKEEGYVKSAPSMCQTCVRLPSCTLHKTTRFEVQIPQIYPDNCLADSSVMASTVSPANAYVEPLALSVTVLGDTAFKEVIKVKHITSTEP